MTAAKDMDDVVTFSLTMDTVIAHEQVIDQDGDFAGSGPVTLADRVAEIIANRLVQQAGREYLPPVKVEADKVAARLVEEKYRQILDREVLPTDSYGQPKGDATTLAELITKRAKEWLVAPNGDRGYGGGRSKTNLQALIDDAVGREFKGALQKAVKDAQAVAVAEVSKQAAEVFAEIIKRAAS